jgi:hypothetical protein
MGMKATSARIGCVLLVLSAMLVGCGPLGPISGGRLRGEVGAGEMRDWSFAAAEETAQIETNPDDPHSVNVWFGSVGSRLYVPTSMILGPTDPTEREWVANVDANPRVRIRIDGVVYPRTAVRVADPDEFAEARAALEAKYEIEPEDRDEAREIWFFRLDPRD